MKTSKFTTLLLALSLVLIPTTAVTPINPFCQYHIERVKPKNDGTKHLILKVINGYGVEESYARSIVSFVKKNSYKDFPTAKDILAIIGIESAFDPAAENKGAYGLMQIQYFWFKKYVTNFEELYNPFVNMPIGIFTLRQYFLKLGNKEDAVIAYQAGIGKFLDGEWNNEYLNRYREELTKFE